MSDIDERKAQLRMHMEANLQLDLQELSESDVRAKLIDPLFVGSLGWPEVQIRRERHTSGGDYIDYECGKPSTYFVIEAKRAATPFKTPTNTHRRTFPIYSLAAGDKALEKAFDQAAQYCLRTGTAKPIILPNHAVTLD